MTRRSVLAVAVAAAIGVTVGAVASGADAPSDAVRFPAGFDAPIYVGDAEVYTPEVPSSTTTSVATTSTAETTTTSAPQTTESTSTTNAPDSTTTTEATVPPSTTSAPPATGGSGCGSSGAAWCEDFSSADPNAWKARLDHGWSGELHAGSLFGADRNGWPMDHDMQCGNPNTTHHTVTLGPGDWGQTSPASAEPAFMSCLPGGDPAKGHLMTSANTEGYIIAWFSPKPVFVDVRQVCFAINFTYIGNGQWFQLVFLTPDEYTRTQVIDGQTISGDLGFTSPDFPGNPGPSTHQGTARNGIKFLVTSENGDLAGARFHYQAWQDGSFSGTGYDAGPATADKAPRYPICVTDNEDGTLRMVTKATDGTTVTRDIPGAIPDGDVRVVLEHDEYNPDKHHDNAHMIDHNTGEGYTYHWDDIVVETKG